MRRFKHLFFLLLVITLVPMTSCDDDDDDVEPSRMDLLTAGEWSGFAIFVNGADVTDFLASDEDEPIDVRTWKLKFNNDGTYTIRGDGVDPSPLQGEWEFTNNEQAIILEGDSPGDTQTVEINKLTSSELFLNMTLEDEDSGTSIDGEIRFRR
ncbi:hypothetical protein ACFSRY_18425 [Pontibacter locisalis]|uniref:Lipocalin-like domain-containing protein n=1 Tax=Pontibacter locisalis TaxID=1719035 RepID=A0ABW5ISY3_9BACT